MIPLARCLPFALACLAAQAPSPERAAETSRLESALKATGLSYERSASGLSYKLVFAHPAERTQTAYLTVQPGQVGRFAVHSIYTTVWVSTDRAPDEALLRDVLGRTKKLGTFYVYKDDKGTWALRFSASFDATDLPAETQPGDALALRLRDTIQLVQQVGEETDARLNGDKDVR